MKKGLNRLQEQCLVLWVGGGVPVPAAAYLNVELERSDGLLQHAVPLLLRELHAVHPAAIQLFEPVGAGHSGEGKERQTLAALQPHGLLGDPTQDLTSRQVTEVTSVSMGNQEFRVFFTDLKKKKVEGKSVQHHTVKKQMISICIYYDETYLSESVAVSSSGSRDNNLLSPVLAVEIFQVFLEGPQSGQFSREVNGSDTGVVAVPVHLFLQDLVDFIQRAQEELGKRRRGCQDEEIRVATTTKKGDHPQKQTKDRNVVLP